MDKVSKQNSSEVENNTKDTDNGTEPTDPSQQPDDNFATKMKRKNIIIIHLHTYPVKHSVKILCTYKTTCKC